MLDIRTMYFLLMLSSVVAGICMLGLKVPPGERRRSAILWGFGSFSVATGLLLIGLRNSIPLWPSAVLGNSLLLWGFLLFYLAFSLLMGRPQQNRSALFIALGYAVIYHFMVTLEVPVRYRITIVSLMLMAVSIGMISVARQPHAANPHTRSARLLVQFFYGT
ncbi:MAG: hypothetical protein REI12_14875, partial [Pedobacter sp.]|nr:hypothetical protein [Pedobacter sp.]